MSDANTTSAAVSCPPPERTAGVLLKIALILVAGGAVLTLLALAGGERERFAFAYLWGFAFVWSVVLGSLFFVALHHLTRAVWSVFFRRIAELFAGPVWLLALLFLPVLFFAFRFELFGLFPWTDGAAVMGDEVLAGKELYLNTPFFTGRAALFFLIWALFSFYFIGQSLRQDKGLVSEAGAARMRRFAAPFMVLFALTVTFASFDWLMSLEPHWFSTIFGVYIFSGMVLSGLAAITLLAIWLRAKGELGPGLVTGDHLYSLGALLFAFTCFWAYIAFSQFMLIWYGNIPEETVYFSHRAHHGWMAVSVSLVAVRFVLPFFLLLSSRAKVNPGLLVLASLLILAGQWLDLYWLIMPQAPAGAPVLGWQELGPPLLLTGILLLYGARFLAKHPALPAGDPLFEKCRDFHL